MRRVIATTIALVAAAAWVAFSPPQNRSWTPLIRALGVKDERVTRAMEKVRRADFLPESVRDEEYQDRPLPIGYGQTTSQPSLIAMMVDALKLQPGCNVLEVGTGSGYQTALLAELCAKVASIEIVAPLAERARTRLRELGYRNVDVKAGDGYLGWPEHAPFDGIVVSAGAPKVPPPLVKQLKIGGRMIIPVGQGDSLRLQILTKRADGSYATEDSLPVSFVPLTGDHADRDRRN